jgi:hypothetical protein
MRLRIYVVASLLLFSGALCGARAEADATGPAFSSVPELASGFHSLYLQNFTEAREKFAGWESQNPGEPFGEVAVAASYLFEELYRQGALSSDFFLNEKKFLNGIEGKPDPARMKSFQEAIQHARKLARQRLEIDARDPEGLFALALSAGMESDADMILKKQHIEALKRLKEANQDAQQLLAVRPTTLSEASLAAHASCFGSVEFMATKNSAWSSLETPLKRACTCNRVPRSCWHWRPAEKNNTLWRRSCSSN